MVSPSWVREGVSQCSGRRPSAGSSAVWSSRRRSKGTCHTSTRRLYFLSTSPYHGKHVPLPTASIQDTSPTSGPASRPTPVDAEFHPGKLGLYSKVRYSTGMVSYGTMWYGTIQYCTIRYGDVWITNNYVITKLIRSFELSQNCGIQD
jgi:hypothetical protein